MSTLSNSSPRKRWENFRALTRERMKGVSLFLSFFPIWNWIYQTERDTAPRASLSKAPLFVYLSARGSALQGRAEKSGSAKGSESTADGPSDKAPCLPNLSPLTRVRGMPRRSGCCSSSAATWQTGSPRPPFPRWSFKSFRVRRVPLLRDERLYHHESRFVLIASKNSTPLLIPLDRHRAYPVDPVDVFLSPSIAREGWIYIYEWLMLQIAKRRRKRDNHARSESLYYLLYANNKQTRINLHRAVSRKVTNIVIGGSSWKWLVVVSHVDFYKLSGYPCAC